MDGVPGFIEIPSIDDASLASRNFSSTRRRSDRAKTRE